jgi:hypothetical protein
LNNQLDGLKTQLNISGGTLSNRKVRKHYKTKRYQKFKNKLTKKHKIIKRPRKTRKNCYMPG